MKINIENLSIFFGRRRRFYLTITVALFGVMVVSYHTNQYFNIGIVNTHISIIERDVKISRVDVTIEYANPYDEMTLYVSARREKKGNNNSGVAIKVPEEIKLKTIHAGRINEKDSRYNRNGQSKYELEMSATEEESVVFVVFTGKIISSESRESKVAFSLDVSEKLDFPIKYNFVGLNFVEISNLTPDPSKRYSHGMLYDYGAVSTEGGRYNIITFDTKDRVASERRENRVLFLGIFLGLLVSIISSAVVDIANEYDSAERDANDSKH